MRLRWISPAGVEIPIETPSAQTPEPGYLYMTGSGFGGPDNEMSLARGAYQDGQTLQSVYLSPRRLSVSFVILAASVSAVQARRRAVAAAFNPRAGLGTLVWTQEDGTEYALRCLAASGSPSFPAGGRSGPTWQEVLVDLVAPDPCWYAYGGEELHLAGLTGGATFPISFPASFATQGATVVVRNEGDIAAPVQITVSGPIVNPVVENLTTGKRIALSLVVAAGEQVAIDTTYGSLYCRLIAANGTQTNAMAHLSDDSEFWQVVPGENILTYSATSGSAEVVVRFASRYTGV